MTHHEFDSDLEELRRRQLEIERMDLRRKRYKEQLDKSLADPDNKFDFKKHPFPWTAAMVIWDGPGVQFFDANNAPVLSDLLRDQDDAAILLDLCNTLGMRNGEA